MHIHEFQQMMRQLYFHCDSERGVAGTFNWLADEIHELGDAIKNGDKKETEDEFADVIAWLASLANVLNIDLEKAAITKYSNKCPKCSSAPCRCTF